MTQNGKTTRYMVFIYSLYPKHLHIAKCFSVSDRNEKFHGHAVVVPHSIRMEQKYQSIFWAGRYSTFPFFIQSFKFKVQYSFTIARLELFTSELRMVTTFLLSPKAVRYQFLCSLCQRSFPSPHDRYHGM